MKTLHIHNNINQPIHTVYNQIINNNPPNFIEVCYRTGAIYDECENQIGYLVSIINLQQIDINLYINRANLTLYIFNQGSITSLFVYTNNIPSSLFPDGLIDSSIVSTTDKYLGKKGIVYINSNNITGSRDFTIIFDD